MNYQINSVQCIKFSIVILIGLSISMPSCKNKDASIDVYVAGQIKIKDAFLPAYWKNGKQFILAQREGKVTAITVSGKNVYAVGYLESKPYQIVLWTNGIIRNITDGLESDYAYNIAILGKDVYIVGYKNNNNNEIAAYWKNGIVKYLADSSHNSKAYSIAVSGNNIYIAGYKNSGTKDIATYWKNGTAIALTNGDQDAYGCGIALSGADVYIGGLENKTIKYWKNDDEDVIGKIGNSSCDINCIAANGTDVYMAGFDYSGTHNMAKYWKNKEAAIPLKDNLKGIEASQIAVAGDNVYVTGEDNSGSYLWKNGIPVPPFNATRNIFATALYIVINK